MKKIIFGALITSMAMTTAVQANKLDGAFVAGSISLNSAEMTMKDSGPKFTLSNDGNNMGFGLNVGYGQSFDQFYLGADIGYKTSIGKAKLTVSPITAEIEAKNLMVVSILPGFYVQPETLLFARLGMGTVDTAFNLTGESEYKSSSDGTIIGFGAKHIINNNITGVFEYQQVTGDKTRGTTKNELTATSFNFGLQYNF